MVEIEKPRISCVETLDNAAYGKYVVEPLERGYGMTLGNSLRRILLSSLPGYAATSIKIAGVQHEFTTIPGVKEDVTEIVLNIKRMIVKLHSQGEKTVYVDAVGPCKVTAGDIKTDADVEILNPDLLICTLGPDATFNMEITLSQGGLCSQRPEQDPADPHRRDPRRLPVFSRYQGELYGGAHPCG